MINTHCVRFHKFCSLGVERIAFWIITFRFGPFFRPNCGVTTCYQSRLLRLLRQLNFGMWVVCYACCMVWYDCCPIVCLAWLLCVCIMVELHYGFPMSRSTISLACIFLLLMYLAFVYFCYEFLCRLVCMVWMKVYPYV